MSYQLITFGDITNAILSEIKGDADDAETLTKVRNSINRRQVEIASKKKWKWLRITDRSLTLNQKYTTGTITVASGSRTVTGNGTTFTSAMRGRWIKPTGAYAAYKIISVLNATSLLISSPLTGSSITAGTYKIYQSDIALPPDLSDLDDLRVEGDTELILPRGPRKISELRQKFPEIEGKPRLYTIDGEILFQSPVLGRFILGYDFQGQGQAKALSIFPHIADQDYTLTMIYKQKIRELTSDSQKPQIPEEHRTILFYYVLADWHFSNSRDTTGSYYQGLADKELKIMEGKYLDTDDMVEMKPLRTRSERNRRRNSSIYFDTSD